MQTTDFIPREVPIVGPTHLVRETLRTQHRKGLLLSQPQEIVLRPVGNGMVQAQVRLLTPVRPSWRRRHPVAFAGMLVTAGLTVLFGIGWAVIPPLINRVAAGPALLVMLVTAASLLWAVGSRPQRPCVGVVLHCRGCKH